MRFTFTGCSITQGVGLDHEKNDPGHYANLVGEAFCADVTNLGKGGHSNHLIFMSALENILFDRPDKIFVQWTALNRWWVYPEPNTEKFMGHTIDDDYRYNELFYSREKLQEVSDIWHSLTHDYKYTFDLIDYCNILEKVCGNETDIIFIDGSLPWTADIVDETALTDFDRYFSDYTKELFNVERRDDEEIRNLFTKMRKKILETNPNKWVSQFNCWFRTAIDQGHQRHPGIKSHRMFADQVISHLG